MTEEKDNPCAAVVREVEAFKAKSRNGGWADRIIVGTALALGLWWLQNQFTVIQQLQLQIASMHSKAAEVKALQNEVMRRLRDVEKELHSRGLN